MDRAPADSSASTARMTSDWKATLNAVAQQPHKTKTALVAAKLAAHARNANNAHARNANNARTMPATEHAINALRRPSYTRENRILPIKPAQPKTVSAAVMAVGSIPPTRARTGSMSL